jgi:hypothetical protein
MVKNLKIFLVSLLLIPGNLSCDKESPDPRDKYIGQYQVREVLQSYGFPECGPGYHSERDTIIIVDYGLTDSTLSVLGRDVWLDANGWFNAYHYGLRLWNDSISSYFMSGGLGCGTYISYVGVRISGKT